MTALTLADLVSPVEVSYFFSEIQGKQHRHFPGPANRFAELMPWPALAAVLSQHRLAFPRLRLAHDGQVVPIQTYTEPVQTRRNGTVLQLQTVPFAEQLRAGATLVLDSIEELYHSVGELARRLEHDLRERIQVNLYAGRGITHGFDNHWDDHDGLIVQVVGRKRWRLYGPTRPAPLYRDVQRPTEPPTAEPIEELMLTAGDVLYVPRGHWHDVTSVDELSLHLTIGFNPATGVDLVNWLADQLRTDELFRRDLPRYGSAQERTERANQLRNAIMTALTPDVVDQFLTDRDSQAPAFPQLGLPWAITADPLPEHDEATVRMLTPRAVLQRDEHTVVLLAAGRRFVFAGVAAPVLTALIPGNPQPIKDLIELSELDRMAVRGLLAELTAHGLLASC